MRIRLIILPHHSRGFRFGGGRIERIPACRGEGARGGRTAGLLETFSSLGLRKREVSVHPDVGLIEGIPEWRLGVSILVPGLQVAIYFTERDCPLSRVPESGCADQNTGKYGLIKGLEFNPGEYQLGRAAKHCIVETEDLEAWQIGECSKSVVEVREVLFDAALVFVQYCPRRRGILAGHVTGRLGPREEVSYGVCLSLGLALRENRLSCLYETDIGHMHRELSQSCAIEQLRRRRDLVVRRSGVRE